MPVTPQTLYLQDPFTFDFEASVVEKTTLPDGRSAVILDRTYFYPTGGGQEHDSGSIASACVLDVQKSSDGLHTLHLLDRDLPLGPVQAHIDPDRRIRHMQHHTGQHLLSQCCLRQLDAATLSANINGYSPSTIDLDVPALSSAELESLENLANHLIFQNLAVKSSFVSRSEAAGLPLRKLDIQLDEIRLVEIDSFDYSACAGTHCTHTGSIGMFKVVRTERQNEKIRLHFQAGLQALEGYRSAFSTVSNLSAALSVHPRDLPSHVHKLANDLQSAHKDLASQRTTLLEQEALHLLAACETIQQRCCILQAFQERPTAELRQLATRLQQALRTVAVFSNISGEKITLLVSCSPGSGAAADELLQVLLSPLGARGGGDHLLAQGGGTGDLELQKAIMQHAAKLLRSLPALE